MAKITFKENLVHTNGQLPALDTEAPDFKLVDGELNERTLADYAGKKKVIYMTPSLDTSVCALSTKKFSHEFKKHSDAVLLVVSADLPFAQSRFCSVEHLKNVIPLSMMRSKDFAQSYGMLLLDGPLAGLLARSVLILDEDNKVIYRELIPEITHEPDYEKALKALSKA